MEFKKSYEPKEFETKLYKNWEENGYFKPTTGSTGKTFYIPIPPPNVTGNLHLGHALTVTLEDIMVRYHRMKGDSTLWVPGTDHAGIATQSVVEKKLAREGKNRVELGREEFLKEVWKWKDEYAANINGQVRLMGSSVDWTKERFTLDEKLNKNVEYVFCDLYKKGLIYRGEYMVNYSPALQTVVSDIEIEYKEEEAKMYYITYFVSGSDNELIIATTRPETLLADVAVAVHPKDKRYKKMIGRSVILPIVNKEIPIIGDESVDREFGTGALKITPSHDPVDFQIAKKHSLKLDFSVIDRNGNMTKEAGIFAGQDYLTARENIVELLRSKGNLIKIEPYTHKVGYCERSGCKIETVISTQWFVKAGELAKNVMTGYKKKEFTIIPDRYNKIFEDWMNNLRDWCISRQLWWGHQIPAYFDIKTGELLEVTTDEESVYKKYGQENVRRDDDVLDTWFSSALWPFSILDWTPENPGELYKKYYPAQVLETGHDILPFWVVRMLLMGYEYTGQTPFKTIYLHGLIRDEKGRKMSKSLGNGINPIEVIDEYSTDSLRLALIIGNTPGNNMNFSIKNVESYSIFLNKLWNITRFVDANIGKIEKNYDELKKSVEKNFSNMNLHEKWILQKLSEIIEKSTTGLEKYNFSFVGEELIYFTRDEFADFYIEEYKLTKDISDYGKDVLSFCILSLLKLWHPYIPFITEELYSKLYEDTSIMISTWPELKIQKDSKIDKQIGLIYDIIKTIRNIRAENNIKPGDKVNIEYRTTKAISELILENSIILNGLAKVEKFEIIDKNKKVDEENKAFGVAQNVEIYIDLGGHIDIEGEKNRLKMQIDEKKDYIRKLDMKLMNAEFIKNAPEQIVRIEQEKKLQAEDQLQKLVQKFQKFQ